VTELISPCPAEALAGLLGVPLPDLDAGDPLPLCWHWVYLLDRPATEDLGADGHPVRGVVPEPPGPGRRRMWAGGRVEQHGGLVTGHEATRRSEVTAVHEKEGSSGHLTFVEVTHTIEQRGRPVVVERQDIVYRAKAPATESPAPAAADVVPMPSPEGGWTLGIGPALLFRFSALTYNAHRIHYDRDYATGVEGYPGLVTHGPLQALAMAEAARRRGVTGDLIYEYRLVAPLFDFQGMSVLAEPSGEGDATEVSVCDLSGRVTARGRLTR
jgi:3-methylfumaryl-CoA hydratase